MNVSIKGKGSYSLNKSDFVASGGEGQIFRKGQIAFKVYTDRNKMIPSPKIQDLSSLTLPNIIKPQDILLDDKNRAIGYTMRFLKDTYALCQLFTKTFRDRFRIAPDTMIKLVGELRKMVSHCHSKDILIVDLNEMNFLVDDSFSEVYAIDCDSYQTKNYPATAIMDSIRDRHSKKFSEETDWFSFGIISFQMFIGIHPYKGKHPKVKSLDERMLANLSVLNKDVGIPAVCYPFSNIPKDYLDWYKAIFEEGKRLPPPDGMQAVIIVPKAIKIAGSNNFIIKKILEYAEDIIRYDATTNVAMTSVGLYSGSRLEHQFKTGSQLPTIGATASGKIIAAWIKNGKLSLFNATQGKDIDSNINGESLMAYDGNIYFKNDDNIYLLSMFEPGMMVVPTAAIVCPVMAHATKLYDGVAIQNILGAFFACFFRSKSCFQVHIKEIDGLRLIDAKFENGVLMILAFSGGKYNKYIIRLASDFKTYDVRIEQDVGPISLNFVTLPKGVCAHLNSNDELELFSIVPQSGNMKVIDDPALSSDMKLYRNGNQVLFAKGNELYSIELRKTP